MKPAMPDGERPQNLEAMLYQVKETRAKVTELELQADLAGDLDHNPGLPEGNPPELLATKKNVAVLHVESQALDMGVEQAYIDRAQTAFYQSAGVYYSDLESLLDAVWNEGTRSKDLPGDRI